MTGATSGPTAHRPAGSMIEGAGSGLSCSVEARDGRVFELRPIRPDDAERLKQFHEHLSVQSVYRRFFFVHPKLSTSEIERFTQVDGTDRLALVVLEGHRLIAVGRYDRVPQGAEAEVAFVVADEFHHCGIATLLLEHLAAAARSHGITTFFAETLCENHDMLDVFLHSGFNVATTSAYGTVDVRFAIEPDATYRSGPGPGPAWADDGSGTGSRRVRASRR
jgi:GNAT superfamily N-acetyltransferase